MQFTWFNIIAHSICMFSVLGLMCLELSWRVVALPVIIYGIIPAHWVRGSHWKEILHSCNFSHTDPVEKVVTESNPFRPMKTKNQLCFCLLTPSLMWNELCPFNIESLTPGVMVIQVRHRVGNKSFIRSWELRPHDKKGRLGGWTVLLSISLFIGESSSADRVTKMAITNYEESPHQTQPHQPILLKLPGSETIENIRNFKLPRVISL